ncbi:hypothetical protein [Dokdonella sp.]|uniref:hypothetical protein n=1 Tax=Dokdonella sp. TaxID=2291710 RepID=UPI0031C09528|nr:hypothetical protein [Dokdonella sp.]
MRYLILAAAVAVCSAGHASAHELDVVNRSKTSIHHLYLSSVKADEWGEDQLGDGSGDTVEPGDTFTLTDIERGHYDVMLVADDGTECVVEDVRFNQSKEWVITERMLDRCEE